MLSSGSLSACLIVGFFVFIIDMKFRYVLYTFTFLFHGIKFIINIVLLELLGLFDDFSTVSNKRRQMVKDVDMSDEPTDSYDYSKIDSIFYKYANCKFLSLFNGFVLGVLKSFRMSIIFTIV